MLSLPLRPRPSSGPITSCPQSSQLCDPTLSRLSCLQGQQQPWRTDSSVPGGQELKLLSTDLRLTWPPRATSGVQRSGTQRLAVLCCAAATSPVPGALQGPRTTAHAMKQPLPTTLLPFRDVHLGHCTQKEPRDARPLVWLPSLGVTPSAPWLTDVLRRQRAVTFGCCSQRCGTHSRTRFHVDSLLVSGTAGPRGNARLHSGGNSKLFHRSCRASLLCGNVQEFLFLHVLANACHFPF